MKILLIALKGILPDTTYQLRKTSLGKNVAELSRLIADEVELDPITLWETSRGYVILDGFQRIEATRKVKGENATIRAHVKKMHENSTSIALKIAIACNQKHGAPFERADRKEIAIRLLQEDPHVPDTQIAKFAGFSARTIGNYRKEVDGAQAETRVDVNGREIKVRKPEKKKDVVAVEETKVEGKPAEIIKEDDPDSKEADDGMLHLKETLEDVPRVAPAGTLSSSEAVEAVTEQAVEPHAAKIDPILNVLSGQLADVAENLQNMTRFIEMQMHKDERSDEETEQLEAIKGAVSNLLIWQSQSFEDDQ